jgi:colicin import membrane protein
MSHRPVSLTSPLALAVLLGASLLGDFALAAQPERAQLRAERNRLSEAFAEQERSCSQQFLVTACLDDARARRRDALTPLRERELRLDEAERQTKAEQRRQAIAAKQAMAASQPTARPAPPVRVRSALPAASAAVREPRQVEPEDRAAAAAIRARELEAQRHLATQAQQRVDRREAERQAAGRKSAPLPTPTPAASAARGR